MRTSRKKMINVTCSEGVRKRVDQFLAVQYQAWKQTHQPRLNNHGFFTCGTQANNTLIMDYVRFIYQQYGIRDPLLNNESPNIQHRVSQSRFPLNPPKNSMTIDRAEFIKIKDQIFNTPKPNITHQYQQSKIQQEGPIRKTSLQFSETVPKKALFDSRDSTHHRRQNSYQIDRSSINAQNGLIRKLDQSQNSNTGRNGPRNSQPIRQILSVQFQGEPQSAFQTPAYTTPTNKKNQKQSFFKYSRRVNEDIKRQSEEPVPEVYRYCIACQNAVLDVNIQCHEKSCKQFAKVYELDLQGILSYLHEKIEGLKVKVIQFSENLDEGDCKRIKTVCSNMDNQCEQMFKTGMATREYIRNYDEAIKIGRKWSLTTEQINKLRWFVKIREQIKKKFNA